jgi:hypothetical protein
LITTYGVVYVFCHKGCTYCLVVKTVLLHQNQLIVFQQRLNQQKYREILGQRSAQFRAIQRRLLTKYKDKTPSPLANLDTLLDGTYRQVDIMFNVYSRWYFVLVVFPLTAVRIRHCKFVLNMFYSFKTVFIAIENKGW